VLSFFLVLGNVFKFLFVMINGVEMAKSNTLNSKLAAEFLGTLFFVFLAAGSVVSAAYLGLPEYLAIPFVAVGIGLALALAVSATMGVSGGQLNPAVTIGLLVAKKMNMKDSALYIVAQVLGATVGAALLFVLFPASIGNAVYWGSTTLGNGVTILQGIVVEAILTFFLVMAVFGTAVDERAPKIGGFGIGLTVMLDILVGGAVSGASMNPARSIGPALVSMHFAAWYVYWIGPIIGAIIAALFYSWFIMKK
jgi:MIP family channel proteins